MRYHNVKSGTSMQMLKLIPSRNQDKEADKLKWKLERKIRGEKALNELYKIRDSITPEEFNTRLNTLRRDRRYIIPQQHKKHPPGMGILKPKGKSV